MRDKLADAKLIATITAALVILLGSVAVFFFGFDPTATQTKFLYGLAVLLALMMGIDIAKLPLQRSADKAATRRLETERRHRPVSAESETPRATPEPGPVLTLRAAQRAAFVQAGKVNERGDFDVD